MSQDEAVWVQLELKENFYRTFGVAPVPMPIRVETMEAFGEPGVVARHSRERTPGESPGPREPRRVAPRIGAPRRSARGLRARAHDRARVSAGPWA